jgi:hypothetical protein
MRYSDWGSGQAAIPGTSTHAATRLRLRPGEHGPRHTGAKGLARAQEHPAHGALHGAGAGSVQGSRTQHGQTTGLARSIGHPHHLWEIALSPLIWIFVTVDLREPGRPSTMGKTQHESTYVSAV